MIFSTIPTKKVCFRPCLLPSPRVFSHMAPNNFLFIQICIIYSAYTWYLNVDLIVIIIYSS